MCKEKEQKQKEVHKMMTLDKAIRKWGFEDPRTITIAVLEENGRSDLAVELFATLTDEEGE